MLTLGIGRMRCCILNNISFSVYLSFFHSLKGMVFEWDRRGCKVMSIAWTRKGIFRRITCLYISPVLPLLLFTSLHFSLV